MTLDASIAGTMNSSSCFSTRLDDLAVIEITGADAVSFLHGQLTQDVAGLPEDRARLAGYCTPKGRLLATLVLWRAESALYALVKADIATALVKRLSMYVLRAKAKLRIAALPVTGLIPGGAPDAAAPLPQGAEAVGAGAPPAHALPSLPAQAEPWTVVRNAAGTFIAAPAGAAQPRWWWMGPEEAEEAGPLAAAPGAGSAAPGAWQALDIAAGLPWIVAATQDVFIPQTLNLDLIDGVHFTKGCYPGQEVVARSHYRGTVKRRMAGGVVDAILPQAGELPNRDIYDAGHPDSPCGRIVNAAARAGQTFLLMEIQLADLGTAQYRLESADGPAIALQPLPYDITAAEQAQVAPK